MSDPGQSARRIRAESPLAPVCRVRDREAMPELEAYFGAAANLFDAQGKLTNESTCDFPESFAASIEAIGSGQIDELEEAMAQMASFLATLAWLQGTAGRVMKLVP